MKDASKALTTAGTEKWEIRRLRRFLRLVFSVCDICGICGFFRCASAELCYPAIEIAKNKLLRAFLRYNSNSLFQHSIREQEDEDTMNLWRVKSLLTVLVLTLVILPATLAAAEIVAKVKVGEQAPDFTLPDQNNKPVKLSDFRGKKNVVLAFYVLAFTAG